MCQANLSISRPSAKLTSARLPSRTPAGVGRTRIFAPTFSRPAILQDMTDARALRDPARHFLADDFVLIGPVTGMSRPNGSAMGKHTVPDSMVHEPSMARERLQA